MDDIVIRPAVEGDAQAIGELWEKLVAYHHALDPRLPTASDGGAALYARRVQDRIDDTHTRFIVAERDGVIVGYVLGVIVDMVPEMFRPQVGGFLADIFVEETMRGHGIGRRLVEALTDWFHTRGVQHMEWYVAAHNDAGRKFWDAVGGKDIVIRMRMGLQTVSNNKG